MAGKRADEMVGKKADRKVAVSEVWKAVRLVVGWADKMVDR